MSIGASKAPNFNSQNIGLNNCTSTMTSRLRTNGTSIGTSNNVVVAAAISAAAAVAAMSGAGIVNKTNTLSGLRHLPSLHSSNLSGNNLVLGQNKSSSLSLSPSSVSTVTSASIPSSLSSSSTSSPSPAAIVNLLKAQHQQQNLAAAATAIALQQHNQMNGTNSQNSQAILAALMLQNLNNPNQLLKQSLNNLSFPLENIISSNIPLATQSQQSQTTMFNGNNNNNNNSNNNNNTTFNYPSITTNNMNMNTNSSSLNSLNLLGLTNSSINQSNINSDLLVNQHPQHLRSYQMLKQTLGNLNPIISNNLSQQLANTPFLTSNLNFPTTTQLNLPSFINQSNNVQNSNLFTLSSSPSTSNGSLIPLGANFDLNSNETKLWLASMIGNNTNYVQSDLNMTNNNNNSLTNQIYQMYKLNTNLNDTTKMNSLTKTTSLNMNETKMNNSLNTLTDSTNMDISQIHNISNNNNTITSTTTTANDMNTNDNRSKSNEHTVTQNLSNSINTSKSGGISNLTPVFATPGVTTPTDTNNLMNVAISSLNPFTIGLTPFTTIPYNNSNSCYLNGTGPAAAAAAAAAGVLTDLFANVPTQQPQQQQQTSSLSNNSNLLGFGSTNCLTNFWPIIPSMPNLTIPAPGLTTPLIIGNQNIYRNTATTIPRFTTY
ncbi:unnamed protein product [Schistosoma turkestanicum]|nr:unnamed protein product [Schistosoma turkestanicum]